MKPKLSSGIYLLCIIALASLIVGCSENSSEEEPLQDNRNIRTTEPLTPEEERVAFRLPEGFEAQLFAAEPDIGKPLNMSFDSKGRMWVTQSYEYPFPDTTGVGRDQISILEDTDGDGTADLIKVFADSLNIPIGIQVVEKGVIVYSIPNIWYLIDHDGDDRVDERRVLFSGFQHRDTHGMVNNFVRLWDGWIHADHGFSNTSRIAGSDGDSLIISSGNTFRFRTNGSRAEFTTTGRVNPFGYAFDEWGYTYSVDCHTSPVYQLVRGADYPHFGKQPTGIGFGPSLMSHDYGSTALAGLEYYLGDQYPEEFRNSFYYGDVVLSRVSRSRFRFLGTTPVIQQEEDFIISDDPWFRPVDVKMGPDGALYIADFYNRIIGHYEVPLDHPGRDRQRGRIWRIVHKDHTISTRATDLSVLSLEELIVKLRSPNLPYRLSVSNHIEDRFGDSAIPAMKDLLMKGAAVSASVQALWYLFRFDALDDNSVKWATNHPNDTVRVHSLRILAEMPDLEDGWLAAARSNLEHESPHVRRQAVMVVGKYPRQEHVASMLQLLKETDSDDTHFYYSIRQSLRDQLRSEAILQWVNSQKWADEDSRLIADVIVGVENNHAGVFLVNHLSKFNESVDNKARFARHAARWLKGDQLVSLVRVLRGYFGNTNPEDYPVYNSLKVGLEEAGVDLPEPAMEWAKEMATAALKNAVEQYASWHVKPVDRQPYQAASWQMSEDASGHITITTRGGNSLSILESPEFSFPGRMSFDLTTSSINPSEPLSAEEPAHSIELVLRETGEVLEATRPTGRDFRGRVSWTNASHKGKSVFLRIQDGSSHWNDQLQVGGFQPIPFGFPALSRDQLIEQQRFALQIARDHNLEALQTEVEGLLTADIADVEIRNEALRALIQINPQKSSELVSEIITAGVPLRLKELWLVTLSSSDFESHWEIIVPYLSEIPYQAQKQIAINLSATTAATDFLMRAASEAIINPRLVFERQVYERLSEEQLMRLEEIKLELNLPEEDLDQVIREKLSVFAGAEHSAEDGKSLFKVQCAVCHEVGGEGGNIGPQLDGIGSWGSRALTEKIIDPNRNISSAFQVYTIRKKDGTLTTGLFRREDGELSVFADFNGQEFSIANQDILEKKPSPSTLMPDHFRKTLNDEDFSNLLAYLLTLKSD